MSEQLRPIVEPIARVLETDEQFSNRKKEFLIWADKAYEGFGRLNKKDNEYKYLKQVCSKLHENLDLLGIVEQAWVGKQQEHGAVYLSPQVDFIGKVADRLQKDRKNEWVKTKDIDIVKVITASSNMENKRLSNSYLKGFFEGPKTRKDVVRASLKYSNSLIDMVNNRQALERGLAIIFHQDEDVMSIKSDFYKQFIIASQLTFDDDAMLADALACEKIFYDLLKLTNLDHKKISSEENDYHSNSYDFNLAMDGEMDRLKNQYPKDQKGNFLADKIEGIKKYRSHNNGRYVIDRGLVAASAEYEHWPEKLLSPGLNKQLDVYEEKAGSLVTAHKITRDYVDKKYEAADLGKAEIVTFPLFDSMMIDICIPGRMSEKKADMIGACLKEAEKIRESGFDLKDIFEKVQLLLNRFTYDNSFIFCFFRKQAGVEKNLHPLSRLAQVGMPKPSEEVSLDYLKKVNDKKAEQILDKQTRYLQSRRFRVAVENESLKGLGYTHFDFSNDVNTNCMKADIGFAGHIFSLKFDRNLAFAFDGQEIGDKDFVERARYVVLSFLEPVITKDVMVRRALRDASAVGVDDSDSSMTLGRIAYFMKLRSGANPRASAIENYMKFTHGTEDDFWSKVSRLKSSRGTDCNFSFVPPRYIERDADLQPISVVNPEVDLSFE